MTDADDNADESAQERGQDACSDGGAVASAAAVVAESDTGTDGISQVGEVARREYRVLSRERWPLGLALAFAVFSTVTVWLGTSSVGPGGVGALLVTMAELSVYLVPLAALALGYSTVVGAEQRGSLESLLALPVSRQRLAVGLFVGRAGALAVGLSLGLAAGGLVLAVTSGLAVLPAYLNYLLAAVAVGWACLAVGVAISTLAVEKARALAGALVAWIWFVFVYDLVALWAVVALDPPAWGLDLLVVGNPVDVLRVVVLSLVPNSGGGVGATLATTTVSLPAVVLGIVAWIGLPLLVAGRLLARRHR